MGVPFTFFVSLTLIAGCLDSVSNKLVICDQVMKMKQFDSVFGWNSIYCHLHQYSYQDVVECLDNMSSRNQLNNKPIHFAFVGDSRIRQAFHSFWPIIPNYDQAWIPNLIDRSVPRYQDGLSVESTLLNIRVSFGWFPKIEAGVLHLLRNWTVNVDDAPEVIIIGISSHHMEQTNPRSYIDYEQQLNELAPLLETLATRAAVIWLHQNAIIDNWAPVRNVANKKLDDYNILARKILQNTGVVFWESSHRSAEEYVRSCAVFQRRNPSNQRACLDLRGR